MAVGAHTHALPFPRFNPRSLLLVGGTRGYHQGSEWGWGLDYVCREVEEVNDTIRTVRGKGGS